MGGGSTISTSETRAEALKLQSSAYGAAVPVVHGKTRISGNLLDYGNFKAIAHTETQELGGKGGGGTSMESTTYTYSATVLIGLCEGPLQGVSAIWAGKVKYTDQRGPAATSIISVFGNLGQPAWSALGALGSGHSIGYSGMALMGIEDYQLGSSAEVLNHNFEVVAHGAYQAHSSLPDADAGRIITDWVTSSRLGRGLAASVLGDLTALTQWSRASGLMFSPALTEQAPAADRINQLCELVHAAVVPADGKLHFVPLATEPVSRTVTAAGGETTTFSYTPDVTPLFELGPDQYLVEDGQARVKVIRATPADVYNLVRVEFRNRNNEYALDVAVAEDRANIDVYGSKPAQTIKADWIHDHETAQTYARMKLQRYLTAIRTYEFDLPWGFAEILPSNLLLINDDEQGLEDVLVRVERMDETEDGWHLQCVDCPAVQSAAPLYGLPQPVGFTHGYAALPGDTVVKAVFEAPYAMSSTGLEVWAAIEGAGADWGGAHVWVSLDGVNFKKVGTSFGASRSGKLSGSISSGTLSIDEVTGKVLSGSLADAQAKATLCYIGGASPEFLSYTSATLVAAGAYQLTGLVRAQYGTAEVAHADNDVWVRCDEALASSGPLELVMIGRQVSIKFQSFNKFGLEVQDLADVTAVTYTVTGRFAVATSDPQNLLSEGFFGSKQLGAQLETWTAGQVIAISGQPFTRALQFGTLPASNKEKIACREGDSFYLSAYGRAMTMDSYYYLGLAFCNAAGEEISYVHPCEYDFFSGWLSDSGVVVAPAGTAYAYVRLQYATPTASNSCYLAEVTVRRQAKTVDIVPGAATGTYKTAYRSSTPITITSPEYGSGDAHRQVLLSLTVSTPVLCAMLITVFADAFTQNAASGFSAANGSGVTIAVYSPGLHAAGASDIAYLTVGAGANNSKSGPISLGDLVYMKPGTWTVELRASKSDTGSSATLNNIQFRLEMIKL